MSPLLIFWIVFQVFVYVGLAVAFVGGVIYYLSRRRSERESENFERRDN